MVESQRRRVSTSEDAIFARLLKVRITTVVNSQAFLIEFKFEFTEFMLTSSIFYRV